MDTQPRDIHILSQYFAGRVFHRGIFALQGAVYICCKILLIVNHITPPN